MKTNRAKKIGISGEVVSRSIYTANPIQIYASNDNKTWTKIKEYSATNGTSGVKEIFTTDYRYLKVNVMNGTYWGAWGLLFQIS